MKAVILAGGKGTRLAEYTKLVPKPMVEIKGKPIITFIIKHFYKYGVKEIIIASGYKHEVIKKYFSKVSLYNDLKIKVVNTGLHTLTGKRINKLKNYLNNNENFFLTYGDGIGDINLSRLLKFHIKHKKIATLTAVHPPARFGELKLKKNKLIKFDEKPQLTDGWINGGFFVFNRKIFNFLNNKNEMLEREPIQKLIKKKNLMAFKHDGFWMCMDTSRDKQVIEKVIKSNAY
jgi:glucose-1-phosphate cytidylyltransferase